MINKVILIGNLGRDPEVRTLESGTKIARFSVATNENYRDKNGEWQQSTEWHNVSAWTYLAERAEKSLKKGSLVYVEGKLTHRKYTDKDNVERMISEVRAIVLRSLEPRGGESGGYGQSGYSQGGGSSFESSGPDTDPFSDNLGTTDSLPPGSDDDDLPF